MLCAQKRRFSYLAGGILLGAAGVACSSVHTRIGGQSGDGSGIGGQTGDGTGNNDVTAEAAMCATKVTVWNGELTEDVEELGFAPQAVLDELKRGVDESISWAPNADIETEPESGIGEITLTFSYEGGEIRVRQPASAQAPHASELSTTEVSPAEPEDTASETSSAEPLPEGAPVTPPYQSLAAGSCSVGLEIDVLATIETGGGALSETFPVTLLAANPGVIHFEGNLPNNLSGSLQVSLSAQPSALRVVGIVSELGSSGQILALLPPSKTDTASASDTDGGVRMSASEPSTSQDETNQTVPVVAAWPADTLGCAQPGVTYGVLGVPPDSVLFGKPLQEHLALAFTLPTLPLWWHETETETTLEVSMPAAPNVWCVTQMPSSTDALASFTSEVRFQTHDGVWEAQYPTAVSLSIGRTGTPSLNLVVNIERVIDQGTEVGFKTLDVSADTPVLVSVGLYTEEASVAGYVQVSATETNPTEAGCRDQAESEADIDNCLAAPPLVLTSAVIGQQLCCDRLEEEPATEPRSHTASDSHQP